MSDKQQIIIDKLKSRCEIYRMERETLLRVIKELTDMLQDKEDKRNQEEEDLFF